MPDFEVAPRSHCLRHELSGRCKGPSRVNPYELNPSPSVNAVLNFSKSWSAPLRLDKDQAANLPVCRLVRRVRARRSDGRPCPLSWPAEDGMPWDESRSAREIKSARLLTAMTAASSDLQDVARNAPNRLERGGQRSTVGRF